MRLYVHRNTMTQLDHKGPLAGVARSAFHAVAGIPVFHTQQWVDVRERGGELGYELASPGMVGTEVRSRALYVVAADGEAVMLPLRVEPARLGTADVDLNTFTRTQVLEMIERNVGYGDGSAESTLQDWVEGVRAEEAT